MQNCEESRSPLEMKGKAQVASAVGLRVRLIVFRRRSHISEVKDVLYSVLYVGAVVITASQMELVIYH